MTTKPRTRASRATPARFSVEATRAGDEASEGYRGGHPLRIEPKLRVWDRNPALRGGAALIGALDVGALTMLLRHRRDVLEAGGPPLLIFAILALLVIGIALYRSATERRWIVEGDGDELRGRSPVGLADRVIATSAVERLEVVERIGRHGRPYFVVTALDAASRRPRDLAILASRSEAEFIQAELEEHVEAAAAWRALSGRSPR